MLERLGQRRLRYFDGGVKDTRLHPVLILLGKSIVIATLAGLAAMVPQLLYAFVFGIKDTGAQLSGEAWRMLFATALAASFIVGLPVALLTFFFAGKHIVRFPITLLLIAGLAIIMMTLASFVVAGSLGIAMFALPAALAAAAYAVVGYLWIIKPLGAAGGDLA